MLATILSGAFVGVDAYIVQVEVNISDGFLGSQVGVGWKKSGLPSL